MSALDSFDLRGIERFEVREKLGTGGFGEVYRVYDRRLGATVALKTLQRAEPSSLYLFKKEFRALAELSHPNLVQLYEFQVVQDRWFFTMELVEGVDFVDFVRRLPALALDRLPRLRAALGQLAEGLAALHRTGKLHCDIKPSNIRVTPEGRVVLLDFGLVQELAPARSFDTDEGVGGTPAYMSPEQAAGTGMSPASDWYAFGVVLFEALTGRRPFTGGIFQLMADKQERDAPAPSDMAEGIPADLDALCRELLAREAEKRPSGEQVLERLGAAGGKTADAGFPTHEEDTPLVGRENLLAELRSSFELTRRGQAVAVFVNGRSGIGKTALIRCFIDTVQASHPATLVLSSRCYEQESVPYKGLDALIDMLSRYLKHLCEEQAGYLIPANVPDLARLFPVLRRVPAVEQAPGPSLAAGSERELKSRARAALCELLRRLAERQPLILSIDDLQWSDRDSAELLAAVFDPPHPPPLLLIGCYRDEGDAPELRRLLEPERELTVRELSLDEARQLASILAGADLPETRLDEIARESRGSPFFVTELVRAGRRNDGEVSLERLIADRTAELEPDSRELLRMVAVAGQPIALEAALKAAELTSEPQAALKALRTGHFLRTRGRRRPRLETYHDRIRETVVAGLDEVSLESCYRRLINALEATGEGDPETLALYFEAVGERTRAAELAATAADQAAAALAFDRAVRLYRKALDLEGQGDANVRQSLEERLGHALSGAARYLEAAEVYLASMPRTAGARTVERRLWVAWQQFMGGELQRGLATMEEVASSVGVRLPRNAFRTIVPTLLRDLYIRLRGTRFTEREAREIPDDDLLEIDVYWSASHLLSILDPFRGSYAIYRHLLLALAAGETGRVARGIAFIGVFHAVRGSRAYIRSSQLIQEATALAQRVNHPYSVGIVTYFAGLAAVVNGHMRKACELFERATVLLREDMTGVGVDLRDVSHHPGAVDHALGMVQYYELSALYHLGRFREIFDRLPGLLQDAKGHSYFEVILKSRFTWWMRLAADQPDEALREVREASELWPSERFQLPHLGQLRCRVETALYRGEGATAWERLEAGWPPLMASRLLNVQFYAMEMLALRCRTALAAAHELGSAAASDLRVGIRRDLRRLEAENYVWARPLAQLVRAGLATLDGDADAARDLLAAAEAGFESTDRALLVAVCRLRRGQLARGATAAGLLAESRGVFTSQGFSRADRMADVLAPGAWHCSRS